jgi:hypothetical protein
MHYILKDKLIAKISRNLSQNYSNWRNGLTPDPHIGKKQPAIVKASDAPLNKLIQSPN